MINIDWNTTRPLEGDAPHIKVTKPNEEIILFVNDNYITKSIGYLDINGISINEIAGKILCTNYFSDKKIDIYISGLKHTFEFSINKLKGKNVLIKMDSSALGDTIAAMPMIEMFKNYTQSNVILSTFYNELFQDNYDIVFIPPNIKVKNTYTTIYLGNTNNKKENPYTNCSYLNNNLQKVAGKMLGIDFKGNTQICYISHNKVDIKTNKYVVVCEDSGIPSLKGFKGDWNAVCKSIMDKGYDVVIVGKNRSYIENCTLNISALETNLLNIAGIINKANLFIGVSSGLTWMAHSLCTPLLLVSDFTPHYHEFKEDGKYIFRIGGEDINEIEYKYPKKTTTTEQLIEKINQILNKYE